uniref:Neurobeachin n=1 Tax=Ditylenchus dipsaci TaxID=166011 RepID=A0A915DUB9_9BILA
MRAILLSPSGAWWSDKENDRQIFWRLDLWEDDSRRRKRFVPNVYGGCRHSMAMLKTAVENGGIEADKAHEQLLKDLAHRMACYLHGFFVQENVPQNRATLNELVDESDIEKWASEENDLRAQRTEQASYSTEGKLIAPGIIVPGTISITATDVYFDADEEDQLYKQQDPRCLRFCDNLHGRWHFQEIRAIFLRRYALQYVALELFLASRTAIMFCICGSRNVKKVVEQLPRVGVGVKYGLPQARKTSLMSPRQLFKHSDMPSKWQRREISNFDYLMFLNTIAGRTYNDLNQYPIFPWIFVNFRDLSKPIGALSESRKKYFQERFNNWDDESISAFHYGTHYSTQAFTVNWLFRIEPFATFFLNLQKTWEHCQKDTHDVKEIIPELFYLPEMFYNNNDYNLGKREDGAEVNNVVLPAWANSPEHFVMVHRQALESDLQRGPEAVRATNVFYYLTYEGAVNLNSIENKAVREGIQQQILNFGQTPVQLMTEPHPPRHSIMTMPCTDDLCMLMKFISNSPLVHITANTFPQLQEPSVLTITQNLIFAINKWNSNYNQSQSQSSGSLSSSFADKKSDATANNITQAELPLTVDPLLAVGNPSQPPSRRHLGDAFDQRLNITWSNFVCTVDSAFIFACGYPDYSFRLIETENATVRQVIYGHGDVVTCLARSEASLFSDCYIASGSLDCTSTTRREKTPSPRAILTGHDSEVTAICVSAEHGIVISGSKGSTVLMHTTQGDLLRHIVDGEYVVLGTANGRISILRLFPLQLLYTFPQTDSPLVYCCSTNQRLIFWRIGIRAVVVFNVDFNKWHYEYKQRYNYR